MPAQVPTRILIAIEDSSLKRLVHLTLGHGPYACGKSSGLAATRMAMADFAPHLLILDIDDADGRAMELITEGDSEGRTPTIALARRSDLRRQFEALDGGADDCIGLPFVPGDLIARVHAVLRRAYGPAPTRFKPIRVGELEIDLVGRDVRTHGTEIHLTALEPRTDRLDPAGVYFGTASGELWGSADAGRGWSRIAEHLPAILSVEAATV